MCGISGVHEPGGAVDPALVRAMTRAMLHRGPDGEGFHLDGSIGLGMRRLAIVDVEHGQQPLYNEDRSVAVVFNGEIYNHDELRRGLERNGHRLDSRTDGAVLPHLYEERGAALFEELNGIFAIAVWDARAERLLLARDRLGVKPLYWSGGDARLAFASELKALLEDPETSRALDLSAIDRFLTFRFFPSPTTPFAGVRKLPPATVLTADRDGVSERRYWNGAAPPGEGRPRELVERYADAFERAVVRQMMSDRPIGVMLSGGVDSGAITAVMARNSSQVRTFTIGFEGGGDADETQLAEETARRFGTRHESLVVPTADYLRRLPESYATVEEPIGTSSALAVQYVSEMMKPEVPVGLSGQGVDELMGGYWRYVGIALAQSAGWAAPLLRPAARIRLGRIGARAERGLTTLGGTTDLDRLMRAYTLLGPVEKARLYRPEVLDAVVPGLPERAVERFRADARGRPLLDQMLHVDVRLWLPDELLLIADKMSMAASVELRVPFLDNDVVALAESIPGSARVSWLRRKHLHKRAMLRWLPREVVYRKERGWATPMAAWLRRELHPLLREVLLADDGLCRALFREDELSALMAAHQAGERDLTRQLFCLLGLGLWHRSFGGGSIELRPAPAESSLAA